MNLGIDCDGVVGDWEEEVRRYLKARFDRQLPVSTHWHSIRDAIPREEWGWLWDWEGLKVFKTMQPYSEAREALEKLRRSGHRLHMITSVPREAWGYRVEWLRFWGLPIDELTFIQDLKEKARIGCDHYIDDNEEACAALFKAGKRVTMVARPWNSGFSSPGPEFEWCWPRVASIAEWEP